MNLKSVIQNRTWLLILDQCIFSGMSLLTTVFLARILDLKTFGLYSANVLIMYLVLSIFSSIVTQSFQVNVSSGLNKKMYQSFGFCLYSLLMIILCVITLIVNFYFPFSLYFLLFSIGFLYHDFFRRILLALDKIEEATIIDFILAVSQFSILTYVYFNSITNLSSVLIFIFIGYIPALIYGLVILSPFHFEYHEYITFLKFHISQGKWLTATAVIQWWSSNQFVLYSSLYIGLEALAVLRLVQSIFGIFNLFLQSFENYFLPQSAFHLSIGKNNAIRYIQKISQYSLPVVAIVLILTFIYSSELISLIGGDKFSSYGYLMRGFTILYGLIWIAQPIRIAIRILLLNRSFFIGYLLTLILSVSFSNFLLREYQLYGTMIGLIGSQFVLIVFWQYILVKNKFNLCKSYI